MFGWQTHASFSSFVINELNAGRFKSPLYFHDRRKIAFYNPFDTFNPLNGREADARSAGKFSLAPAQQPAR